jgi:serine O-acetyltransferase
MNLSEQVKHTAEELLPLYAQEERDLPERPLWQHPCIHSVAEARRILSDIFFPGRYHSEPTHYETFFIKQLEAFTAILLPEIKKALPFRWMGEADLKESRDESLTDLTQESERLIQQFISTLPSIRKLLIKDVEAAYNGDPAALSYAEVKLAYPGLLAIMIHRVAHEFYQLNIPLIPRMMSEAIHSKTGIDIHPGAQIGEGFFIDHGTGVVIGETTRIGKNVKLYQGVTLGAKSFPLDEQGRPIKHIQRHPTVEDDVIIYANSTILGGDTIIGAGTVVAGNVFLMQSAPANSLVVLLAGEVQIRSRNTISGHGFGI